MEPEVQKLAISALVGLMLLFPVFNQVQATSLEALRDADHRAKFKDIIKSWDDIPEDEKLSYWDGRNKPPGDGGDFDSSRVDDDARVRPPSGSDGSKPAGTDSDGDGTPDVDDPDPNDPLVDRRGRQRTVQEPLWEFYGGNGIVDREDALGDPNTHYRTIDVTWEYSGFNGRATFALKADGRTIWNMNQDLAGTYTFNAQDSDSATQDLAGPAALVMDFTYEELSAPDTFHIVITGTYVVYDSVDGE